MTGGEEEIEIIDNEVLIPLSHDSPLLAKSS